MLFGWHGFQLEHPDDWAPTTLTGNRTEGYARLASPDTLSGQVRWKTAKASTDLRAILDGYLNRLASDAKKQKITFDSDVNSQSDRIDYEWSGKGRGSGSLIYLEHCSRAFFIEASATNNRSVQGAHRSLLNSFTAGEGEMDVWAVFGLAVRTPRDLVVGKHTFQSGRTRLEFRHRRGQVIAERWGFAEQILRRHSFADWAAAALEMPLGGLTEEEDGVRIFKGGLLRSTYGLAQYQRERNQLVILKVASRSEDWRPTWDWLL